MLKNNRPFIYLLFIAFAFFTCSDYRSFVICLPLFLLCIYQVNNINSQEFTPDDMFWFCVLLYFGVVPTQALSNGFFPVFGPTSGIEYGIADSIKAMLVVLFFVGTFALVLNISRGFIFKNFANHRIEIGKVFSGTFYIALVFLMCIGFLGYILFAGGAENVSRARTDREVESVHFFAYFMLSFGGVALFNLIFDHMKNKKILTIYLAPIVIGLLLLWVCVNIFNAPRFFLLATWMPIVLMFMRRYSNYTNIYVGLIVGIFLIMPILSVTTRYGDTNSDQIKETENYSHFLIKDVDIFETIVHSVGFVDRHGFYGGDNLLAIIGFAVPRSIWPEKPIVGGLLVGAELYGIGTATTPNLSYFIAADAYMDFWFFGVIIVGAMCGLLFSFISCGRYFSEYYYIDSIILISIIPILIRGPVGAIIGYPLCLLVCSRIFSYLRRGII